MRNVTSNLKRVDRNELDLHHTVAKKLHHRDITKLRHVTAPAESSGNWDERRNGGGGGGGEARKRDVFRIREVQVGEG